MTIIYSGLHHPIHSITQLSICCLSIPKLRHLLHNYGVNVRYKNWDGQIPKPKQKIKQGVYYNMEMPLALTTRLIK